ncbi:hypothetical protein CYMTET_14307 [Cymbomonas tetramitiformis]|uniref:HTH merR-type domain-containing protein n=1 Tax=Cymbomonas tetramitiformis TaxID=36881 RepID=A0AAE0GGD8_9CHLO|nr:hypothetical protein CYMTET_14307 [Cymbomonas tetramitiformis]
MTSSFVKLKFATKRLGVTGRVLRYWDAKGLIATMRTPGGTRLFDVDGYLAKKATEQRRRTDLFGRPMETIRDSTDDVANDDDPTTPPVAATSSLDAWKMEIDAVFKSVHEKSKNNASEFLIHLDKAATWIGFTQKVHAKRHLVANYEEGNDFTIRSPNEHDIYLPHRNAENIYLTGDCFKAICMTANTARGKLVRQYYLSLEKRLRDGDLTLAGEIVHNHDVVNNTKTDVLLRTGAEGIGDSLTTPITSQWERVGADRPDLGKAVTTLIKQTHRFATECVNDNCMRKAVGYGDVANACGLHGGGWKCAKCGIRKVSRKTDDCYRCSGDVCEIENCENRKAGVGAFKTKCRAHGGGYRCARCKFNSVQRKDGVCAPCDAHGQKRLRWQNQVKAWLDDTEDLKWYSYVDEVLPCADNRIRADFWFLTDDHSVVLEVDEQYHATYEATCEIVRQQKVHDQRPEHPLHLVRYNPNSANPNIKEELLHSLRQAIAMPNRSRSEPIGIYVEYIGYPRSRQNLLRELQKRMLSVDSGESSQRAEKCRRMASEMPVRGMNQEGLKRFTKAAKQLRRAYARYIQVCKETVVASAD